MRIFKPLQLGLLTRPYLHRGRHQMGVTVMAFARMPRGDAALAAEPLLLPEAELWKLAGEVLDEDEALDLGVPKPCAEFLASGRAYSHDPASPGRCAVLVQVAGKEKHLLVTGRRAWVGDQTTEPEAVDGVPVDWRHAYGGPAFDENPVGIGAAEDARGIRLAPQVEAVDDRMMHPHGACQPAGFGPISPTRPRRFALSGKYDPGYAQNAFPGLPDTLDPHFFNTAPPDQWFVGQPALPPGAAYRIGNMHAEHAVQEGRLPRWQARAFVQRHGETGLDEVLLRNTTVWFFPDRECMLLLYQGAVPIATDDGSELALIMPALEQEGAPRELAHYLRTLARRQSPNDGAVYALVDADLVPAGLIAPPPEPEVQPRVANQRQRAVNLKRDMLDRVKEAGLDPAHYQLEADPAQAASTAEDLPAQLRLIRRRTRQARAQALRQRREARSRLDEAFQDAPAGSGVDTAALADAMEGSGHGSGHRGPPRLDGGSLNSLLAMAREAQRRDPSSNGTQDVEGLMRDAQARMKTLYRHAAHHQQPVDPARYGRTQRMRRRVEALMQGSRDLSGLDLTGVDLSRLDLSGARCRGTWMEGVDLRGTRLNGADLREAVLTRADLIDTDCTGADFSKANLGGILAQDANFANARFEETVLDKARFEDCTLHGVILRDGAPAGVELIRCDMQDARLSQLTFWQDAFLAAGKHAGARLERVVWLDSSLEDADYAGATLTACAWVQSRFDGAADFRSASLTTCCAVQTDLPGARFSQALLRECNLRGIDLAGADFSHARLLNSDLSEASLRDADFTRADARASLFMAADLQGATLRDADLIDALMSKSDFRHADLRGANLFRADMSQGHLDASTRTAGAYVKFAKTLPVAPPKARP